MPYNGSGVFTPEEPEYPAIPDTTILASDFNTIISDIAGGLSVALPRDGQAQATNNIGMGNKKLFNLAAGTAPQDAVNVLQVFTDPHFAATTPTGVEVTGTRLSVTTGNVTFSTPDFNIIGSVGNITITDFELDAATVDANATTSILLTTPVLTVNAATSVVVTAPTIALNGSTTATLTNTSTTPNQAELDNSTKIANTHQVSMLRDRVKELLIAEIDIVGPTSAVTMNLTGVTPSLSAYGKFSLVGTDVNFDTAGVGTNDVTLDIYVSGNVSAFTVTGNVDHVTSGTALTKVTMFKSVAQPCRLYFEVDFMLNTGGSVTTYGDFKGTIYGGKSTDATKIATQGNFQRTVTMPNSNIIIALEKIGNDLFQEGKLRLYGQLL